MSSGGSMGGARPVPPLPFFTILGPNWGPKGWKNFGGDRPPPSPPPPNFEKIMVLILHKEVESKLESVSLVWS